MVALQKATLATIQLHFNRFFNSPTASNSRAFADQMGQLNTQMQARQDNYVSLERIANLILKSLGASRGGETCGGGCGVPSEMRAHSARRLAFRQCQHWRQRCWHACARLIGNHN